MFEVTHRSHRGRSCLLTLPGGTLSTPASLGAEGPFSVSVGEGGRSLRLGDSVMRLDGKVSKTKSSGPFAPEIVGNVALIRMPIAPGSEKPKDVEAVVVTNAAELRLDPRAAVEAVVSAREYAGHGAALIAPGLADPSNAAIYACMGIDAFDDSVAAAMAEMGVLALPTGQVFSDDATIEGNVSEMRREIGLIRTYIEAGRLRELAEIRAASNPFNVALLRLFDSLAADYQEKAAPAAGGPFRCNTTQSLMGPDPAGYRRRFVEKYRKPAHKRILLLLPCSARKPYHRSKSHRAYSSAVHTAGHDTLVHEVILTSPLGVVPRELDVFFPASAYDIPVTGEWKCQEREFIRSMLAHLLAQGYDAVVSHLGDDAGLVSDLAPMVETAKAGQVSRESLDALDGALREAAEGMPKVGYPEDRLETTRSMLAFQFDAAVADALLDGAEIRGKYPYWKVFRGKEQVCMASEERGMFSMTLAGAGTLARMGVKTVTVGDFDIKGSVFAVGVLDADPSIRVGEEVAVVSSSGSVVATGVAAMSGREMVDLARGVAVRIRHRA
ncbi:MAG: DUF5591 domain-containing protein [Thermoplasmatales archaeon]|nr:DUF5591 domain-containing protein [Thermoplasmatales archaeon]